MPDSSQVAPSQGRTFALTAATTRSPSWPTSTSLTCPRDGAGAEPGHVLEGDGDPVGEHIGARGEPGAADQPHIGPRTGAFHDDPGGALGRLQGVHEGPECIVAASTSRGVGTMRRIGWALALLLVVAACTGTGTDTTTGETAGADTTAAPTETTAAPSETTAGATETTVAADTTPTTVAGRRSAAGGHPQLGGSQRPRLTRQQPGGVHHRLQHDGGGALRGPLPLHLRR